MKNLIETFIALGLDFPRWIIKLTPDVDVGLGISYLWLLPHTHPLHYAGVIHDLEYQIKIDKTSYQADKRFLRNCLKLANGRFFLIVESYTFFTLARSWGVLKWHQIGSKSLFCRNDL